jgi:hypothetical protein
MSLFPWIPDSIFAEVAANPNQYTDVNEIFRQAEEIIFKWMQVHGAIYIREKSEQVSEEFKEAGNKSNQSGNLREAFSNYNKW